MNSTRPNRGRKDGDNGPSKTTNRDTLSRIGTIADALTMHIDEALTVVNVSMETYDENNEPLLAILDLLGTTLRRIEKAMADIVALAPYGTTDPQNQRT